MDSDFDTGDVRHASASASAEKFIVRLPPGMRQRIADVARNNRRSMNSEIVARLEASLSGAGPADTVREPVAAERPAGSQQMTVPLSGDEVTLVNAFRRMPDHRRRALLDLLG